MKSKLNDIVSYMTLVAGIVTIVWFIQDSRKENSKVLKRQEQVLIKIEEGQRKGFESLQKSLDNQTIILGNVVKSLEIQTKILQKIEAKPR